MSGEAQSLTDQALVDRAARGDRDAFGELVVRHQASVFRIARLLTRTPEAAEDILQQTFLSAWRSVAQFRAEASVRTWLLTIARNAALHHRHHAAREPISATPVESIAELGLKAGWGGPSPEDLALGRERLDRLTAAFARLTPAEREVLTLRDLEGLSGDETAAMLGLSLPAVKSRLHRARLALAVVVREEAAGASRRA